MSEPQDKTVLTAEGRRRLIDRARRLREQTLPALSAAIEDDESDESLPAEYQRAARELDELTRLIETARSTDEIPEDPDMVQVGDWVTVTTADGTIDRYLIVHPAEAIVDLSRVSADSPLAQAVLGRRVGDEADVGAPGGSYRVRILEVLRDR